MKLHNKMFLQLQYIFVLCGLGDIMDSTSDSILAYKLTKDTVTLLMDVLASNSHGSQDF